MTTLVEDRRNRARSGEDRRRRPRLVSFLGGLITFQGGLRRLDCLVRNLAPRGARLVIPRDAILPDQFDLAIAGRSRIFRAQVIWRRDKEMGVKLAPLPASTSPTRLERRVRELEAENAALKGTRR